MQTCQGSGKTAREHWTRSPWQMGNMAKEPKMQSLTTSVITTRHVSTSGLSHQEMYADSPTPRLQPFCAYRLMTFLDPGSPCKCQGPAPPGKGEMKTSRSQKTRASLQSRRAHGSWRAAGEAQRNSLHTAIITLQQQLFNSFPH